jgi:hypothetical protein
LAKKVEKTRSPVKDAANQNGRPQDFVVVLVVLLRKTKLYYFSHRVAIRKKKAN